MEVLTQPVDHYDFLFSSFKVSQGNLSERHLPQESALENMQSHPATILALQATSDGGEMYNHQLVTGERCIIINKWRGRDVQSSIKTFFSTITQAIFNMIFFPNQPISSGTSTGKKDIKKNTSSKEKYWIFNTEHVYKCWKLYLMNSRFYCRLMLCRFFLDCVKWLTSQGYLKSKERIKQKCVSCSWNYFKIYCNNKIVQEVGSQ